MATKLFVFMFAPMLNTSFSHKSLNMSTNAICYLEILCIVRLVRMRAERERSRTEMKDLQQQLSDMHDELDHVKKAEMSNTEKKVLMKVSKQVKTRRLRWTSLWDFVSLSQDVAQLRGEFQGVLQVKEEQEEVLRRRERELSALKGALKEEVETHDKYMAALKDEYERELGNLRRDLELSKEVRM